MRSFVYNILLTHINPLIFICNDQNIIHYRHHRSRRLSPCEVDLLLGDPTKATEKLGWTRHYDLDTLIDDVF